MAREAIRRRQFDSLLGMGFVSYHLIEFSREALRGDQNASYYSARSREAV
jgi:hopanoid C-2 methylase